MWGICNRAVLRRLPPNIFSHFLQFTSFIVLVVSARCLHCNTATRSPPACLALTVPTLLPHGALAIPITQVRTAVCEKQTGGERGREVRRNNKREGRLTYQSSIIINDKQITSYPHIHTHLCGYDRTVTLSLIINHMVAHSKHWLFHEIIICHGLSINHLSHHSACNIGMAVNMCTCMTKRLSRAPLDHLPPSLSLSYLLLIIQCR